MTVSNLHRAVARDQDIPKLQIAVDNSLLMRRRQATRHLLRVFRGFARRQRSKTHPLAQRLALHAPVRGRGARDGPGPRLSLVPREQAVAKLGGKHCCFA